METQQARKKRTRAMMMEDFFMLSRQVSLAVVSKFQQYQLQSGFAAKWRTSSPPKSSSIGYFARFAKEKEQKKSDFHLPSDVLYSPSWEWHTTTSREGEQEKRSRRRWSVLSRCASVSQRPEPKTALSLLQPWTIPRVEEGPGQVGGVCAWGRGNKWSQFAGTMQRK